MKTFKFPSQNESMYEVSSKPDNGKVVKDRGKIVRRGWGRYSEGGGKELKNK